MFRINNRKIKLFANIFNTKNYIINENSATANKILLKNRNKPLMPIKSKDIIYLSILNNTKLLNFHAEANFLGKSFSYHYQKYKFTSNFNKFNKFNFSSSYNNSQSYSKSNYDFTKINQKLNSEVLFQIFEKCELSPKYEGHHLRLKICPLCEKPHNYDKTNMHSCTVNTENLLFNCFRCGNKGHVIRILKFLKKKFNNDLLNEIMDSGNYSSTESEDTGKRIRGQVNENQFNNKLEISVNKRENINNSYSDFSDLEFYKVNSNKYNTKSGNVNIALENEFNSDSDSLNDYNRNNPPVFSPLLKNKTFNKISLNNSKDPFSFNKALENKNCLEINNCALNCNQENLNSNEYHNKNNSYSSSNEAPKINNINPSFNNNTKKNNSNENINIENKPKFSISPISSINGVNINNSLKNSNFKISISNINLINEMFKRINFLEDEKLLIVKDYLVNERKISEEVLRFYKIGASFERFKNNDFDFITLPTVTFPMFYPTDNASYLAVDKNNLKDEVYQRLNCDKFFLSRTKIRAIGKEFKHFMKIEPAGAVIWGLFGLDTIPEDAKEIVITEGEYDAMSVYQCTGLPTVSLPNGATNLPTQMLSFFAKFKKIYLWMDADQAGKIASENFAKKLGETRTLIVNTRKYEPDGPKDANDAMRAGKDLKQYLDEARPLSGDNIITVTDLKSEVIQFLTSYDQYSGYKSISFDFFNQKLKGLRMGEFSILTGETGSGKTTFLTQLSLDFLQQRVPTLWGSFEIKNDKLISLFLMQLAKKNLRQASVKEIEYYAELLEKFPLYLLKFHGSQSIDEIMNTMNYAVYNFDIQNIVLDNLQFMVGVPSLGKQLNKFDYQDEIIQKMRKFATEKNIHLTLVIHPKKTDEALKISSIFGTAKASQEADNIYIIQSYKGIRIIEIAKNRFDGSTGKVALAFDTEACRYFEMEESEFTDYTKGIRSIQEIINERIKLHGKVEYKTKEYSGVNYDKILEFDNRNLQEKLIEMKNLNESLIQEKQNLNNINFSDDNEIFSNNNKNLYGNNRVKAENKSQEEIHNNIKPKEDLLNRNFQKNNHKQESIAKNYIKTGLENQTLIHDQDFEKQEKQEIKENFKNEGQQIYKLAESGKIEEIVAKNKRNSSKKSSIIYEAIKNPISEKFEEKKRIPKQMKKIMDVELPESKNSKTSENEKELFNINNINGETQGKKSSNSDISEISLDEPLIMNHDLTYDESSLFNEVNESIKTIIQEEVLIEENKFIISSNAKNSKLNEESKVANKDKFYLNEKDDNKEKNKKGIKKRSKKENSKSSKEETEFIVEDQNKIILKEKSNNKRIMESSKNCKDLNDQINYQFNKEIDGKSFEKENNEITENKIKLDLDNTKAIKIANIDNKINNQKNIEFALNEEEKKKVFNNETYNQAIEKETIDNINKIQEIILPEINYVENFHTPNSQEKAVENDTRNKRKTDSNKYTLFAPLKYTNN